MTNTELTANGPDPAINSCVCGEDGGGGERGRLPSRVGGDGEREDGGGRRDGRGREDEEE